MNSTNEMKLEFRSKSQNESFARVTAAAFAAQLDPTMEEISDIKTAVSEAVTNAVIHGYAQEEGVITMICRIDEGENAFYMEISDAGLGIENIEQAMEPLYTTKPELERSGMGFAFMEAFTDSLEVISSPGEGTCVKMKKIIRRDV